jgi:glycine cleavage system aminomethyltransferase T
MAEITSCPIRAMKFSISPFAQVYVQGKVASDLLNLVEASNFEAPGKVWSYGLCNQRF